MVDTLGLFDTDMSERQLKQEISKCVNMMTPGPHAIIQLLQLGPFTEEEQLSVEKIRAIFGEETVRCSVILFTHVDELTNTTDEQSQTASIIMIGQTVRVFPISHQLAQLSTLYFTCH